MDNFEHWDYGDMSKRQKKSKKDFDDIVFCFLAYMIALGLTAYWFLL